MVAGPRFGSFQAIALPTATRPVPSLFMLCPPVRVCQYATRCPQCSPREHNSSAQSAKMCPTECLMPTLDNSKNIVGPRVRLARRERPIPLSQADLARLLQMAGLNLDRSAVAKIETGRRPVSDIELVGIAATLEVSIEWLLQDRDL